VLDLVLPPYKSRISHTLSLNCAANSTLLLNSWQPPGSNSLCKMSTVITTTSTVETTSSPIMTVLKPKREHNSRRPNLDPTMAPLISRRRVPPSPIASIDNSDNVPFRRLQSRIVLPIQQDKSLIKALSLQFTSFVHHITSQSFLMKFILPSLILLLILRFLNWILIM